MYGRGKKAWSFSGRGGLAEINSWMNAESFAAEWPSVLADSSQTGLKEKRGWADRTVRRGALPGCPPSTRKTADEGEAVVRNGLSCGWRERVECRERVCAASDEGNAVRCDGRCDGFCRAVHDEWTKRSAGCGGWRSGSAAGPGDADGSGSGRGAADPRNNAATDSCRSGGRTGRELDKRGGVDCDLNHSGRGEGGRRAAARRCGDGGLRFGKEVCDDHGHQRRLPHGRAGGRV